MMGKKFFTIIVVPHAKAKFRKLRVPYGLIAAGAIAAGLVLISILVLSFRIRLARNPDRYMKEFWTWLSKL